MQRFLNKNVSYNITFLMIKNINFLKFEVWFKRIKQAKYKRLIKEKENKIEKRKD